MMDFVFKEKIDTDKKTAINPITKVEQLTNLRRKHKEEEAEQIVQEVEQRVSEKYGKSHYISGNTLLNIGLIMYAVSLSSSLAGLIVQSFCGPHLQIVEILAFGLALVLSGLVIRELGRKKKQEE